jgi:hypothetical protein
MTNLGWNFHFGFPNTVQYIPAAIFWIPQYAWISQYAIFSPGAAFAPAERTTECGVSRDTLQEWKKAAELALGRSGCRGTIAIH